MNNIILCEGKTDGIILSYYLEKKYGWKHTNNKNLPQIKYEKNNQKLAWYEKMENKTAIFGCGGKTNISNEIKKIVEMQKMPATSSKFKKMVIMIDHDNFTDEDLRNEIFDWINDNKIIINDKIELGKWIKARVKEENINRELYFEFEIIAIIIPKIENGYLEVFLLDALKEDTEDKKIVEESSRYIERLKDVKYLEKEKFRTKAQFQAVLSVISPEWVFTNIDERMKRVNWEKLESVNNSFNELEKL